jgi:hypothetical protein
MYATLEQQIASQDERLKALEHSVLALQSHVARLMSTAEPAKRGPGRPRKTEPDMTTFGKAGDETT